MTQIVMRYTSVLGDCVIVEDIIDDDEMRAWSNRV
jgi:hypothetical protein